MSRQCKWNLPAAWCLTATLALSCTAIAEHLSNPKASYIDVTKRRAELAHNQDPRTAKAIATLKSCVALPAVDPPRGG